MAMSFLGTQPLRTQVPPVPPFSSLEMKSRGSSHKPTFAPAQDTQHMSCTLTQHRRNESGGTVCSHFTHVSA